MESTLSIRELAAITQVDKKSVKAMLNGEKQMSLKEFKALCNNNIKRLREQLSKKDTFTDKEIYKIFGCSLMSGMARSHKTNSLVLSTDTESKKRFYGDFWDGDVLHYTGMGLSGDQSLDFAQNKTLASSREKNIFIALFSKYKIKGKIVYVYRGEVSLAADPYQDEENGRMVYRFILRLDRTTKHDKEEVVKAINNERHRSVSKLFGKLTPEEQRERALAHSSKGRRNSSKKTKKISYTRSEEVKAYAKLRANGICECCGKPAPFDVDGEPFLVCHHIIWLERGGEDSIYNTCALCPNCHNMIHVLDRPEDTERIIKRVRRDEKKYSGHDM